MLLGSSDWSYNLLVKKSSPKSVVYRDNFSVR